MTGLGERLHGAPVTEADLEVLEGKLYFDLEPDGRAYVRFGVLLVLSVVIATGGVLSDSTATVIGAMIVAPLMTPIMALALAIVAGDHDHIGRSLALVVAGAATCIGLSWVLAALAPGIIDVAGNSQITGRTSPGLIDMGVALASGAAGAFALSREDVGDALPGVAIAISLVPPLAVVGTCLSAGVPSDAFGALLLFGTNLVAILIAGGGVLAVMGYRGVAWARGSAAVRRRAAVAVGAATLVILVPLTAASVQVARESLLEAAVSEDADEWVAGTRLQVVDVDAQGSTVTVTVDGPAPLPSPEDLATLVWADDAGVGLEVRHVVGDRVVLEPGGRTEVVPES